MPDVRQNIVVVDDDNDMKHAIERLLNAAGFRAATFASAESLLQDGAAASADCLVLDVHLSGLSGFELRRRLQLEGADTPVIFITAYDDPASRTEAETTGAVAYLTKPFPGQALLSAIREALAREIQE